MNTSHRCPQIQLTRILIAWSFQWLTVAQTVLANPPAHLHPIETPGSETNSITADIHITPFNGVHEVWIALNLSRTDIEFTNLSRWGYWGPYRYFEATNSFVGPIELRDRAGRKVPSTHPAINSATAYPKSYSLHEANHSLMSRYGFYSGPSLPMSYRTASPFHFTLEHYFALKKPGEYKLTVWPKIYKRISPTNDICQRIDLPPVSISIQWEDKSRK